MPYFVYILRCQDGSYYTGYTRDLQTRLEQHRTGKGARYTRMNKPDKIVYFEGFSTRLEAMKREKAIKNLTRKAKLELINKFKT